MTLHCSDGPSWFHLEYSFAAANDDIFTLAILFGIKGVDEDNDGVKIDNVIVTGVAAIPEPEIYAMMLAGIGLMGFAGSQR